MKKYSTIKVENYKQDILDYFGIDCERDIPTAHPSKLCRGCYSSLLRLKKAGQKDTSKTFSEINSIWTEFKHAETIDSCQVCLTFTQQKSPGRPAQSMLVVNLPFSKASSDIFEHLFDDTCPEFDTDKIKSLHSSNQIINDTCQVCQKLFGLRNVYASTCQHMFCSLCLSTLFQKKMTQNIQCPLCRTDIAYSDVQRPNLQIETRIRDHNVQCKTCNHESTLDNMVHHNCSKPTPTPVLKQILMNPPTILQFPTPTCEPPTTPLSQDINKTPVSTKHDFILELLNKPMDEPLEDFEEKILTKSVKRKLNTSADSIIRCKTGGPPVLLHKVTKAKKASSDVRSPLRRRRAKEIEDFRKIAAGKQGISSQLSSELKRVPTARRALICDKAGIKQKAHLSTKLGLAMKSYVGLTYRQQRRMRHIIKTVGVTQANENEQRKEKKILIGDHLQVTMTDFKFKDDSHPSSINGFLTKPAPIVTVKNLKVFVHELLNKYSNNGQLTTHNGLIPNNEIWLKIGGDKGIKL